MALKQKERKPLHLAKLHVHTGDTVFVLAGKDRGKTGTVTRAMPRENKVIVEGINIAKKHMRAGRGGMQSGIIEKPMPLHVSNVMVKCTECGEPTRIAHERVPTGADQKVRTRRVCKKCGKPIQEHTRG
ncbi:MAG: LSU ribosomal protein L24p (L26e) [Ktedonobacterales bacterium]|jgi:large subunit ribosomal protein L24|nr:MAG: LSU ribosomal protein L24p (L26e) [Ktedonobacterales bacterium]